MKTYTVKAEGFEFVRKRFFLAGAIILILFILGLIVALPLKGPGFVISLAVVSAIFILIGWFAFYRTLKRLREVWSTYTLIVDSDYILKQQANYKDIKIEKNEITKILKAYNGDLTVKCKDWRKFIVIPRSLNGIEEVETFLQAWKPMKAVSKQKIIILLFLGILFFFGVLAALRYFLSAHKPSLPAIYIAILAIMTVQLFFLREMRKSPIIDERAKPKQWHFVFLIGYLIVMIIIIAIVLLIKGRLI